ncbi:hypothetical protein F383_20970 [Gossypium arboreum]|nr:hypothetical protein F383_20970 [Gossypium arboreum]
MCQAMVY